MCTEPHLISAKAKAQSCYSTASLSPSPLHQQLQSAGLYSCHVACTLQVGLVADNKHRPMDLRVLALRGAVTSVTAAGPGLPLEEWQPLGQAWEPLLMTGCVIAQEMRAVLKVGRALP